MFYNRYNRRLIIMALLPSLRFIAGRVVERSNDRVSRLCERY